MRDRSKPFSKLPREQEAIRAKCFHPSGVFIPFANEELNQSIPERFETIVALYPDRVAFSDGQQRITYAELNRKANQIARAILTRRSREPEAVILVFQPGLEIIAAILGTLKAGKYYIVLDASQPEERLRRIVGSSRPGVIITNYAQE